MTVIHAELGYYCNRVFKPDGTISNAGMRVDEPGTGQGLGTRIFAQQVEHAAAAGFTSINVHAAGAALNNIANGYYTWPRLGYDASLLDGKTYFSPHVRQYATDNDLVLVSDFMADKTHREWWKANGHDIYLDFDLTPGSQSRRVLEAYVAEKQRRAGGTAPGA